MVSNKKSNTLALKSYKLSQADIVAMKKSCSNIQTKFLDFVAESVHNLMKKRKKEKQVTKLADCFEEIPQETMDRLDAFFDTSLPTITLSDILQEVYSDEYYITRFMKVLPRSIEEIVIRNAKPDTIHSIKWYHQHFVTVTDDHEAKLFFDYQVKQAQPVSITEEEMFIEGGISSVSELVPKITYYWKFEGNNILPPLFSNTWYAFKWVFDRILWKFGVNELKLIYKPAEKMIRIEFEYFCYRLNEDNKWVSH